MIRVFCKWVIRESTFGWVLRDKSNYFSTNVMTFFWLIGKVCDFLPGQSQYAQTVKRVNQDSIGILRSTTRRRQERRLKSEFAFFQSLYRLFLPTYFVNCRRTLMKLNFKGPNSSSEREKKFRRCLFTSSIKREMRHFHVVIVQKRERNVQNSVMHVRSCCCAN